MFRETQFPDAVLRDTKVGSYGPDRYEANPGAGGTLVGCLIPARPTRTDKHWEQMFQHRHYHRHWNTGYTHTHTYQDLHTHTYGWRWGHLPVTHLSNI